MNIFEDKKKRLIILAVLLALAELLSSNGPYNILIVLVQCTILLLILWTAYSLLMERFRKHEEQVKGVIARLFMRVFGPVLKKIVSGSSRKSNYVIGSDKREFLGTWNIFKKSQTKPRKQQRIDIDACEDNSEKIRLLYTKYILKAEKKGRDISYSQTPGEIKKNLESDGGGDLFDSYVHVRYGADGIVDHDTVELCEKITRDF